MGRQYGNTIFMRTAAGITGYADVGFDGEVKGYARNRSSLDGRRWRRDGCFAGSRRAAGEFGKASGAASLLWGALPRGMRRLGDTGAFNRLVGCCRMLGEESEQVEVNSEKWEGGSGRVGNCLRELHPLDFDLEWEGLRGLDFNEDGMGVEISRMMRAGKMEIASALGEGFAGVRLLLGLSQRGVLNGLEGGESCCDATARSLHLRVAGRRELAGMLGGACENANLSGGGRRHVVANRIVDFHQVWERPSAEELGDCREWKKEVSMKRGDTGSGCRFAVGSGFVM